MKLTALWGAAAALALAGVANAQGGSSVIRSRSSLSVASSANMEKIAHRAGLNTMDKQFVMHAAMANVAEIKLGQLAQRNGGAWGKAYGRDMEREHTLAREELKEVASAKGVSLPNDLDPMHKRVYAKLSNLRGAAFDSAYRAEMIKGHAHVLDQIKMELRGGRDEKVRSYAVMMETAVKMHRKAAQEQTSITQG